MGFFKKKEKSDDTLDMPPPPPPGLGEAPKGAMPPMDTQAAPPPSKFDLPPMPGKSDQHMMPPMEEHMPPPMPKQPEPQMPHSDTVFPPPKQEHMLPPMPKQESHLPPMSEHHEMEHHEEHKPLFPKSSPHPFDDLMPQSHPEHHEVEHHEEHHHVEHFSQGKNVFIEVGKYRKVLKEMNNIKRALKQSDGELTELIGDINDEEKVFSKLHSSLADVERKLNDLEGSLFSQ